MATLYKRATPSQARMLRIIEGSIKNEADAHGKEFNPRQARSIAKRAVGTLTSSWGEVLAAKEPSKKAVRAASSTTAEQPVADRTLISARRSYDCKAKEGGVSQLGEGILLLRLRKLEKLITKQMRSIKLSGNIERYQAFVEVLRMIAALKEE